MNVDKLMHERINGFIGVLGTKWCTNSQSLSDLNPNCAKHGFSGLTADTGAGMEIDVNDMIELDQRL